MKCFVVQDNLAFVKKNMKKIYNAIVSREMLKLLTFTQYSKKNTIFCMITVIQYYLNLV